MRQEMCLRHLVCATMSELECVCVAKCGKGAGIQDASNERTDVHAS